MLTRRDLLRATALTGLVVFAGCGADDEGPSVGDLRLVASDLQREVADPAAVTTGVATVRSLAAGGRHRGGAHGDQRLDRRAHPRPDPGDRAGRGPGRGRPSYSGGSGWGAAHLAYAGGEPAMTVVLPDEGTDVVDDLPDLLAPGTASVALTMPRFGFLAAAPLTPALEALGAVDAFDPDAAVVDPR